LSALCCAALKLIPFRKKRQAAKFSFSCSASPAAKAIWPEQVAVLPLRCAKTPLFFSVAQLLQRCQKKERKKNIQLGT
jgi:hypothetical protein